MKKLALTLSAFIITVASVATVHIVTVANFQFTPNSMTVAVGDTVRWVWSGGGHTTTCDPASEAGTSLPAGAATWNAQINSGSTTFSYKVTVAGTYNYDCIYHAPGMAGSFTATTPVVHVVTVSNFQFTPNSMTVAVGDTVRWVWSGGGHTTTCDPANEPGTSLPAGAATWSAQINSGSTTFDYKVTVAGTYNYDCIYHAPNMAGSFTAQSACVPPGITSATAETNPLCAGKTTTLTANGITGTDATIAWFKNGVNVGSGNTLTNATVGTYTAVVSACNATAQASVTITLEVNTWTGGVGNNWNSSGNWSCEVAPSPGDNVIIPVIPTQPFLFSAVTVGNLNFDNVVHLNGQSFTVNGTITGNGKFAGTAASSLIVKGNAGLLRFINASAILKSLELQTGAVANVSGDLTIKGP